MKNKGYAKFGGTNKVRYGRCSTGVLPQAGLDFLPEPGVLVLEHGKELIRSETV